MNNYLLIYESVIYFYIHLYFENIYNKHKNNYIILIYIILLKYLFYSLIS